MKVCIITIALAVIASAQTKGTTEQQAKDCAQNFIGNNNTGTVTCTGVDKKLADLIGQLVAASKRDGKTLKDLSIKIEELLKLVQNQAPTSGSLSQANSGGLNVQQGTTGNNSPIINSPITVGDLPKSIQPSDKAAIRDFFRSAKKMAKVQISADQISGVAPLPDEFYDVLKEGGWTMVEAGVNHYMGFAAPGRRFQGALLTTRESRSDPMRP